MKLTIETDQYTLTRQSRHIMETALAYLFRTALSTALGKPNLQWCVSQGTDGQLAVKFKGTAGKTAVQGSAHMDGDSLKGFEGTFSQGTETTDFNMKISPLAALYILSEAREMEEAEHPARKETPRPSVLDTDTEDGWPYELFDDDILDQRDVFNFPYEFKTPGQMDFCIGGVIACMERTIIELMNYQDKYLDSIDIPSDVCPGISSVYVKPAQCTDILYARLAAKTTDGQHTETTFCQLGADTAADITRYVMRTYVKQPLFVK